QSILFFLRHIEEHVSAARRPVSAGGASLAASGALRHLPALLREIALDLILKRHKAREYEESARCNDEDRYRDIRIREVLHAEDHSRSDQLSYDTDAGKTHCKSRSHAKSVED